MPLLKTNILNLHSFTIKKKHFLKNSLPIQSIVSAFGSEHPCIHDPLKASQAPLHLEGQFLVQPFKYRPKSQP